MGELDHKQALVEAHMVHKAQQAYEKGVEGSRRTQGETRTGGVRRIMESVLTTYAGEVERELEALRASKSRNGAWEAMGALKPLELATIGAKNVLDSTYTGASVASLASRVGQAVENEVRARALWDWLPVGDRQEFRRQSSQSLGHAPGLVAFRLDRFMERWGLDIPRWNQGVRMSAGLLLVQLFVDRMGIMEWHIVMKGLKTIKVAIPTEATLEWLEANGKDWGMRNPWFLPCVCPPRPWARGEVFGGYHSDFLPVIRRSYGRAEALADHEMPRILAALNYIQETPWAINEDVLECLDGAIERDWTELSGVVVKDPGPPPEEPDYSAVPEEDREDAKKLYRSAKYRHIHGAAESRHVRLRTARYRWIADTFRQEKELFFPHSCDFRGRVYPAGGSLNPQGDRLARGLLEFAQGKPLGSEGAEKWFLVHGANSWGEDKVSFEDRIKWVHENRESILEVHEDPMGTRWWTKADRPWEFLAWALEYGDYVEKGLDHVSAIPVGMDGSNNGLQIYSLLLRDQEAAEATNCTPRSWNEKPADIYQVVADKVTELIRAGESPSARAWNAVLPGGVPRAATKRSTMTYPYGLTAYSSAKYVLSWWWEAKEEQPELRELSREDRRWLADMIWESLEATVSSAATCMGWLQDVADIVAESSGQTVQWVTPLGFPVIPEYRPQQSKRVKFKTMNRGFMAMAYQRPMEGVNHRRHRNSIAPNFVHSLDAAALMRTVEIAKSRGIKHLHLIHDSYGTHAADAPILAAALREAYIEIFTPNLLEDFREQALKQVPAGTSLPPSPELGDLDLSGLKEAAFFFA